MSGVSVDVGPPPGADLFRMAYEGGETFMGRIQELAKRKDEFDASLAALNLGKDAKAAYEEARSQNAQAAAGLLEAKAALEKANGEAAGIIAKAKADAADIVGRAQAEAKGLVDFAAQTKAEADQYATATKGQADAALKNAADELSAAQAKHGEAQTALDALKPKQAAAEDAKAAADALSVRWQNKIDVLHDAIEAAKGI